MHGVRCRYAVLPGVGAGLMLGALAGAVWYGGGAAAGGALLHRPWGLLALVDIYVGLALFSAWVIWREPSPLAAAAWVVIFLVAGNLGTCVYVLRALRQARRAGGGFWMGGAYRE